MCWRKPNPCCIKDDFIGPIPDFLIFWFFFFLLTKQILLNEIGPHDVKKKKVPKHMLRHYGGLLVTVQTKLIKIQCCYHLNILIIIVKNYKLSKIDW